MTNITLSVQSPRLITIENVQLLFKNFKGEKTKYNPEGARNFNILVDEETANALLRLGLNVKPLPRQDIDEVTMYRLKVIVNFQSPYPPTVSLIRGGNKVDLDSSSIAMLDITHIITADMTLNLSTWTRDDNSKGKSAYLKNMYAHAETDPLFEKYQHMN